MAMTVTPGLRGTYNKETNKTGLNTNYNQSITVSTSVTYPNNDEATVTITLTSNFVYNYYVMSHGVVFETSCDDQSKGPTSLMGNGRGTYVYAASNFSGVTETAIQPFVQSHTYTVSRGDSDKEIDWSVTVWGSYDDTKGSSTATESGKLTIKSGHTHSAPTGGSAGYGTVTQTSIEVKWGSGPTSWGCSSAAKWWFKYKKSSASAYSEWIQGDTSNVYNLTGLDVNTNYNIVLSFENAHGYWNETSAITVKTHGATPSVSVSNANKLNKQNGVSASANSITVSASNSASNTGDLTWSYQIKKSSDTSYGSSQSNATFTNLEPGTTYVVKATATNADNYSHSAEITIRTKYAQSNFTTNISALDIGLEHINFTATVKYGTINVISSGTWSIGNILTNQTLNLSSASGTGQTGYVLAAATTYTINVVVTLTSTYDSIECTFNKSFTTDAKSSFVDTLGNFNFCYSTEIAANYKITNPSGNVVRCSLVVGGATILTRDKSSNWDNSVDLQLTDAEWDSIYKKLGTNNFVAYTFTVGTYSNKDKNYTTYTTDSTGTITLTGKMKTAHVGLEDGSVKRAQARVGVNNQVRLAVVWVGDKDGKPMRMI